MNWIEKVIVAFLTALAVSMLYLIFVIFPVAFYADAKCLKAGYPVAHVTVGLEIYCSNLTGTVTVKVDKLP